MKQISVFLENRPGRLNQMLGILYKADINILSLAIADTGDYGIVRLIVKDSDKAEKVLKENNITVKQNDVLALEVLDRPGTLYKITDLLDRGNVNIQYTYAAYPMHNGNPVLIVRVSDTQKALEILSQDPTIVNVESF